MSSGAAIDAAASLPGWAAAARRLEAGFDARPTAADLSGRAGVTARPAVCRICLKIGAGAAATGLAGAAAAAIEGAAAAVRWAAAFPGLARQRRAADAPVADLAGRTGRIAGTAVGGIGQDVGAGAAAATFRAGAVDTGRAVRAAGCPTRPRPAVPIGVATPAAGGRVALNWLGDAGSLLAHLARRAGIAAAAAVGGIGLDIRARTAATALLAGTVNTSGSRRATGGPAGARPAVAVGITAAVAIPRAALRWLGDAGSVLANQSHVLAGVADMVGSANETAIAAIGIGTAAARVANPVAEPVARRAFSDAGAVGTDIGSTALAARGANSRRAACKLTGATIQAPSWQVSSAPQQVMADPPPHRRLSSPPQARSASPRARASSAAAQAA